MLEICKKHAFTLRGKVTIGLSASVIFIVAMVFGMLILAAPYAVYADGEKVDEPWVVKVDGQEVAIVDSKGAGEQVITGIRAEYYGDVATQQTAELTGFVSVEKYNFTDSNVHPVVMTTPEAVEYIVNLNEQGEFTLGLETTDIIEETEEIPYETETVETDTMWEGETKVVTEGQNGSQLIVARVVAINGKVVDKNLINTTVTKAPVTKVIYKGTKEKEVVAETPATTQSSSSASSSSYNFSYSLPSSSNGAAVAEFAKQFVGLQYVYGGSSLSSGVDCSGFTSAVFAQFGVSLPRTSYAQGSVGVQVPASQAAPGDLVCYGGHVGIYLGGGMMVHSSSPGVGVIISSVNYASHYYMRVI